MSTLTITSPGVQINEVDLSLIARPVGTTDVLITGFADQGPTEEFTNVTSISEYEQIFGVPTNAAERYLYHSARQILNTSPANLLVSRLPYGANNGEGYANSYSALVYPISTDATTFSAASSYKLLQPTSILLTDDNYADLTQNVIAWESSPFVVSTVSNIPAVTNNYLSAYGVNIPSDIASSTYVPATSSYTVEYYQRSYDVDLDVWTDYQVEPITGFDSLKYGGLVVVNNSKTSVNNLYEGYYVGICDHSGINPSTDFDSVTAIKTVTSITGDESSQVLTEVAQSRLNFTLTQSYSSFGKNSISEILETYPTGYDFASKSFQDSLILVLFKLRTSNYNQDTVTLDYIVSEGYAGSLYEKRTQNNPNGGAPSTFFLDNVVDKKSSNIKVTTNPYIASNSNFSWIDDSGTPTKQVSVGDEAKNLYASGVYLSDTDKNSKVIGNIPAKLNRVVSILQNTDEINVDVVAEAGLGTIWASSKARALDYTNEPAIYDDAYALSLGNYTTKTGLYNTTDYSPSDVDSSAGADYNEVAGIFVSLANDSRKDHVFIADPLRNIFVQGVNGKVSSRKGYIFSDHTYWPIKNQMSGISDSSYVVTYGNWLLVNDATSDIKTWVPASGYVAAKIAQSSQASFPWSAVAGFNRGTLNNVLDLAVNPTQKQRDLLYKINVNPIAFFPNDGFVIYGQKTLYRKPSAFDRLNVRRLFLVLEKETQALLKYFVFEPNTFSTRQRLVGALTPIFDNAKINDGLYDYTIVCDERNNTPSVVDNNELRLSIYIQPVRTAEFILADFIATRTGVNFSELIG